MFPISGIRSPNQNYMDMLKSYGIDISPQHSSSYIPGFSGDRMQSRIFGKDLGKEYGGGTAAQIKDLQLMEAQAKRLEMGQLDSNGIPSGAAGYGGNHSWNGLLDAKKGDFLFDDPNKGWWDTTFGKDTSDLSKVDAASVNADNWKSAGSAVGIASDLFKGFMGWKGLGIAKDQLALSRDAYESDKELTYAQYEGQRQNQIAAWGGSTLEELPNKRTA